MNAFNNRGEAKGSKRVCGVPVLCTCVTQSREEGNEVHPLWLFLIRCGRVHRGAGCSSGVSISSSLVTGRKGTPKTHYVCVAEHDPIPLSAIDSEGRSESSRLFPQVGVVFTCWRGAFASAIEQVPLVRFSTGLDIIKVLTPTN